METSTVQSDVFTEFSNIALQQSNRDEFEVLLGLTTIEKQDIRDIQDELDSLFFIPSTDLEAIAEAQRVEDIAEGGEGLSDLEKRGAEAEALIAKKAEVSAATEAGVLAGGEEALVAEGHIVQDSEEVLTNEEPTSPDTMFTSPIDLQEAGYSIAEDYPDTYGFADTVKNWFKINKKRKYAEFVHASGTMLKCDKDGNTTIEIKGKLKFIQRGEMTHFIGDNLDVAIDGDFYHHIMGELKQMVDNNYTVDIGGDANITVSGSANIVASDITLDSSVVNITGDLKVAKTISDMLGDVTLHKHDVASHATALPRS